MTVRNPFAAWPALAVAGALLTAPDAAAFWLHHGPVYKQRTVVRGGGHGGPVVIGGAGPRIGTATRTESFLLGTGFVGGAEVVPLSTGAEFYRVGGFGAESFGLGGGLQTAREAAVLAEAGRLLSKSGTGSPAPQATPAPAAACPELVGRLDKIETRLGALETRLTGIEAKVEAIVAERQRQAQDEEETRVVRRIVEAVNAQQTVARVQTNRALVELMDELAKPEAERVKNKERIDALRRALTTP